MSGLTNERPFVFKQFEVYHHLCAHKVGFDGVLLGAWTNVEQASQILDLGTGSGLIALMAAQQNPSAHITAIDIHTPSVQQAAFNFNHSPWAQRLQLVEADFMQYPFEHTFDVVVTNPPFYVNRVKAPLEHRQNARHFTGGQLAAFISYTSSLLTKEGCFSVVLPYSELSGFNTYLLDAGYWTKRECLVFTGKSDQPERVLLECTLQKCDKQSSRLYVYDSPGKYSQEYIKLTSPFYLNF